MNRIIWKVQEVLPSPDSIRYKLKHRIFELNDLTWALLTEFKLSSILINIYCIPVNDVGIGKKFNMRFGFIGDAGIEMDVGTASIIFSSGKAFSKTLIKGKDLKVFMELNKVLHFFIEIEREVEEKSRKNEFAGKCLQKLQADYGNLYSSGTHSDITIQVKRKKFNCHRTILAARSPVFSAMMTHDMKEKRTGIINIKDSDPSTFQQFLLYLYTASQEHLNWDNVTDLYKLSDKYDVEGLKSLCLEHIKKDISVDNFCNYFESLHDSVLIDMLIQFFIKHSEKIVESETWLILLCKQPADCNVLIKALAKKR